jgi:predicted metalloprotease with PDZ domain
MEGLNMLHYIVELAEPQTHLFQISLRLPRTLAREGVRLALPAWIPGSYMIREFARHLVRLEVRAGRELVPATKIDKHTWQLPALDRTLTVSWAVYAYDLSVRTAYLDTERGFFNGSSVFLRVIGHEHQPHRLELRAPPGLRFKDWRAASAMTPHQVNARGFGVYEAANYDELIDHPFELGEFTEAGFSAYGVPHQIVISGYVIALDLPRLLADLKTLCEAQIRFFDPRSHQAPMSRYVFLVHVTADGYGGLEHRASTALLCSRDSLPCQHDSERTEAYQRFLGLASHEYFHTWNVKRIKPAAFAPYDLNQENYSRLLWIFEGFTSYYDDLFLVRTGLMTLEQYLKSLGKTIDNVESQPGRWLQSVADSSFDAWIKYYRQDENSPNSIVSYYTKGALVALCLDLLIRQKTRHKKSLDEVMRALWQAYGRDFYAGQNRGLGEDEFIPLVERVTGVPLRSAIKRFAHGTDELPLKRLLQSEGIHYERSRTKQRASLGIKTRTVNEQPVISTVYAASSAQRAGLWANDVLIALEGQRVTASNLESLLQRHAPGERVRLHVFRQQVLREFNVELESAASVLVLKPGARKTGAQARPPGRARA